MASIEILENTLLKLLIRRGVNEDRKQITLDQGELGYASDTERLFVGDGTTKGGKLVGNRFLGSNPLITSTTGEVNDTAFDSDNNLLYSIATNDGSNINDWSQISNLIETGNGSILKDSAQRITVGELSAGNFNSDALGSSIELDTSSRLALSSTINIDSISQRTIDATSYLSIPTKLKISSINYDFPTVAPSVNDSVLTSDNQNQLSWKAPQVIKSLVPTTTANQIPAGTIVPFVTAAQSIPYGWLNCDGASVAGADYPDLSAVIGNRYGGDDVNFNVPDYSNTLLYGTDVPDPFNTTKYNVASGSNVVFPGLSAVGTTYIIKAILGSVQAPTINFSTPLSATLNGVNITDTPTEFLSGSIEVGLSGYKEDGVIYKTVYLDEPSYIGDPDGFTLDNGMSSWQIFSLAAVGGIPTNAKAIFGVIRPGAMSSASNYGQTVYSTYDNSTIPSNSPKKFIIGAHRGPNKRHDMHTAGFSARVDRANNNIYLAVELVRSDVNFPIVIEVHGYSV